MGDIVNQETGQPKLDPFHEAIMRELTAQRNEAQDNLAAAKAAIFVLQSQMNQLNEQIAKSKAK